MQLRLRAERSNTIDGIHRSKNPLRAADEILKLNDYLANSRLHPIYPKPNIPSKYEEKAARRDTWKPGQASSLFPA